MTNTFYIRHLYCLLVYSPNNNGYYVEVYDPKTDDEYTTPVYKNKSNAIRSAKNIINKIYK